MHGVTLGQVYQPLRCCWDLDEVDSDIEIAIAQNPSGKALPERRVRRHVRMLDELMLDWLDVNDKSDRIRLVSGGPGSGEIDIRKAPQRACLAPEPRWRVVFVPLQRLKGVGPLETRKRLTNTSDFKLTSLSMRKQCRWLPVGRDEHRDWLIIFDGLDELAKEGSSSETAAQDFASALADWRGRLGSTAVRFPHSLAALLLMQQARRPDWDYTARARSTLQIWYRLKFKEGPHLESKFLLMILRRLIHGPTRRVLEPLGSRERVTTQSARSDD